MGEVRTYRIMRSSMEQSLKSLAAKFSESRQQQQTLILEYEHRLSATHQEHQERVSQLNTDLEEARDNIKDMLLTQTSLKVEIDDLVTEQATLQAEVQDAHSQVELERESRSSVLAKVQCLEIKCEGMKEVTTQPLA